MHFFPLGHEGVARRKAQSSLVSAICLQIAAGAFRRATAASLVGIGPRFRVGRCYDALK
jgi:hypothetical protein